ncbi:MAG: MoaD/ThiS family protein [Actinomycetota bacterium]
MAVVTVRYWAGARAAAGRDDESVTAGSAHELVASLSSRTPALAPVLELSSLLVDGLVVHDDVVLADGQVVEVLPPFAGG